MSFSSSQKDTSGGRGDDVQTFHDLARARRPGPLEPYIEVKGARFAVRPISGDIDLGPFKA